MTEPLRRAQVEELCNGTDILSSVGWCMLLDTDAALRAQHTADELCIKAQADELTRLRAQLAQVMAELDDWQGRCVNQKLQREQAEQQLAQVTTEREEAIKERKRSTEKWLDDLLAVQQQLAEAQAEIAVADKLLTERNRILDVLPCPTHGPCVPYVLHWIAEAQARITALEAR